MLLSRQVTLECRSDAVPPPTLSWLKDGQALQVGRQSDQTHTHTHACHTCHACVLEASKLGTSTFCVGLRPRAHPFRRQLRADQPS